jgi:hypothetical protein
MTPVTDGQGGLTYRKPLAQFDLVNDYQGYSPIAVKGVQYWLGTNNGLVHTFVDTTVKNGITYYYAVTSFDHGDPISGLPPSECTKFISVNSAYEIIEKGSNVQKARPEAPVSGYVPSAAEAMEKATGSTADGFVNIKVVYPDEVKDDNHYRITFKQDLDQNTFPKTKSFNLINLTSEDTLLHDCILFHDQDELPITDGFRLQFFNSLEIMSVGTVSWNRPGLIPVRVQKHTRYKDTGIITQPGDFIVVTGPVGIDTSIAFPVKSPQLPSMPVNFKIINKTLNKKMKFAFSDKDVVAGQEGIFSSYSGGSSKRDLVIILNDALIPGWELEIIKLTATSTDTLQYQSGDSLFINIKDPFLSQDSLNFTMKTEHVEVAKSDLDLIRVVPNPYVVTADWEPLNPYTSGRGPRELHFINLPPKCTIRIFNIGGQLVRELEHNSGIANGTVVWDMQTKDRLDIAYGIYLYYIDAGEYGKKVGKFAIIK